MVTEAAQSVLARHRNIAEASCDVWGARDLGEEFRRTVASPVPVLLISGSLDLTTPPEQAEEALRGLPHGVHVVLPGARHGAELVTAPGVIDLMLEFLRGMPVRGGTPAR